MNEINESVNYEVNGMEPAFDAIEMAADNSGIDIVKAVRTAGGALVATTAIVALVAWGVKAWKKHNEDKELRKPDADAPVEPTDEQIMEATAE